MLARGQVSSRDLTKLNNSSINTSAVKAISGVIVPKMDLFLSFLHFNFF